MKRILVFLLLFSFCSDTTSEQDSEMMAVESTTTTVQAKVLDETTTTLIQIEQLETFKDINYVSEKYNINLNDRPQNLDPLTYFKLCNEYEK